MNTSTLLRALIAAPVHVLFCTAWLIPLWGRLPRSVVLLEPSEALWRYPNAVTTALGLSLAALLLGLVPGWAAGARRGFVVAGLGSLVLQGVAALALVFAWDPGTIRLLDWYALLAVHVVGFCGAAFCFLLASTATAHAIRPGLGLAAGLAVPTLAFAVVLTPPDVLSTVLAAGLWAAATWTGAGLGAVWNVMRSRTR